VTFVSARHPFFFPTGFKHHLNFQSANWVEQQMDRGSKTPRKGGGRFNTIATSTPSKGMPLQAVKRPQKLSDPPEAEAVKALAIPRNETSMASGHCVQTPKRGGALFNNSSPMIGEGGQGMDGAGAGHYSTRLATK
jgi:hypothetical protein